MEPWLVTEIVLLLVTANGAPAAAGLLMGKRWDWPLDGNIRFFDQRPLLGTSKTLRGLLASVATTAVAADLLGMTWFEGASFGLFAILGDLGSSFIKRRLGLPSGLSVPVLDQLPESALPVWGMQMVPGATLTERIAAVAVFFVLDLLLSRLFVKGPGH